MERIRRRQLEWKARRAQETVVRADRDVTKVVDSEKGVKQTGVNEQEDVRKVMRDAECHDSCAHTIA